MSFILNVLKGIAIGSGAILPGISSGVFCVIFGIYEKLLDSILNFTKDIKNNIRFLFPIMIGVICGYDWNRFYFFRKNFRCLQYTKF